MFLKNIVRLAYACYKQQIICDGYLFIFLLSIEDFEDSKEDDDGDDEEEPEWADDNYLIDFLIYTFELDVIDDVEDADRRSLIPFDRCVSRIARHN